MQLAGHLRGKARQEFTLLPTSDKVTFARAVAAMRGKLDAGSRALAAQEFRHATQGPQETVSDYILRLEKIFRRAYGREYMTEETRKTLLHGQLQERLRYALMKAPAVSGASDYQELCTAAKNEERRLNELIKRQQYLRDSTIVDALGGQHRKQNKLVQGKPPQGASNPTRSNNGRNSGTHNNPRESAIPTSTAAAAKRCYICGNVGHLAKQCTKANKKSESAGGAPPTRNNNLPVARQVTAKNSVNGDIEADKDNSVEADKDGSVESETV